MGINRKTSTSWFYNTLSVSVCMANLAVCVILQCNMTHTAVVKNETFEVTKSLCSLGHVHLTDFNIAAIVKDDLKATSIAGTKPYMGKKMTF